MREREVDLVSFPLDIMRCDSPIREEPIEKHSCSWHWLLVYTTTVLVLCLVQKCSMRRKLRGLQQDGRRSSGDRVLYTHGMRGWSLGWGIEDYTSLYNVGLRIFTGVFGREIFWGVPARDTGVTEHLSGKLSMAHSTASPMSSNSWTPSRLARSIK